MNQRGFTIVELIITITIMGILMVLAVVNVSSSQMRTRDDERLADVQTIALHLETYYKSGIDTSTQVNRYPTTDLVSSLAKMKAALRDADEKSFKAPGVTNATSTFKAATNNDQTVGGVAPQPTINQYVYQPLLSSGSLCTGTTETEDCRKFNLFYRTETDNAVHKITSKNQ